MAKGEQKKNEIPYCSSAGAPVFEGPRGDQSSVGHGGGDGGRFTENPIYSPFIEMALAAVYQAFLSCTVRAQRGIIYIRAHRSCQFSRPSSRREAEWRG